VSKHPHFDQLFSEPIWSVDAKSITSEGSFLVDLTSTINDDPNLGDAHGVLFKWETASTNLFSLPTPEGAEAHFQAVWLVLKPIARDNASSATDV